MDFQLSDDQRALRSGMRDLLGAAFDRDGLRAAVERGGGVDRGLWRELGAAGFFALRLPEESGGVGLGLPEAVLLFEEAGRALLPGPLVATHLAAGLVKGAAEGEAVVTASQGAACRWRTCGARMRCWWRAGCSRGRSWRRSWPGPGPYGRWIR